MTVIALPLLNQFYQYWFKTVFYWHLSISGYSQQEVSIIQCMVNRAANLFNLFNEQQSLIRSNVWSRSHDLTGAHWLVIMLVLPDLPNMTYCDNNDQSASSRRFILFRSTIHCTNLKVKTCFINFHYWTYLLKIKSYGYCLL